MFSIDKRVLNFFVILILSFITFWWTFFIFHLPFSYDVILGVICVRLIASLLIFKDFSLSWSKATQKTFLMKSIVYIVAFIVYMPFYYGNYRLAFMASELAFYLFAINFSMYAYYYFINRCKIDKTKVVVIYGAGKAGIKLEEEFRNSEYKIKYFVDDEKILQKRTIDAIPILSKKVLKRKMANEKYDLLVIAMPSAPKERIKEIYNSLSDFFKEIRVLPSLEEILENKDFSSQLKDITVEDLLARHPQDLDKQKIQDFIKDKVVLITGAGGSIGSEISRQCKKYGAKQLILLDHSEFNLYKITEELGCSFVIPVMQTVRNLGFVENTFKKYKPQIVIHAAAYKHVPLVEENVIEGISNNIMGTKNCIDLSIKYEVEKFVLISTDKAVRPTNVMGTTKRICELYAQNVKSNKTEIVAVRFGNVLGSSGSVIPKFKSQIQNGGPITVTHPDITRYFMLIPEACELVLQAASIGKGGEIFILDMGEPVKIVDLAKKMITLSGNDDIKIEFCGLRAGEKLYEELLINDSDKKTDYDSIMVAKPTPYEIDKLNDDINELLVCKDKIKKLKEIVPEFTHKA
ncbi:dTDP-glucose 4,6-dehydratase [Malaciobacter molluscorum LMG 25693]|uniref:NDP-sugar epimerase, putative UDP-GlcNAc-inverting 4,6-dehydratase FlaA1 n=1 Tax=Malaciobacter molluscorum LMG 25693 TaxID=870501 RepID=A0A2G1DFE0_9BACT|nr:UDP-N-acetylglucosamine 4,6-dehydratase (configuration-retaining) [Malaciobacter molluscorum]AXX91800.1 NDP-sugar epimerase, putative UDP-GlcNAc-inverting 4,6-dehydratase FlaA1 [Malaciobacter molluscorum LMG 25693]PHO17207.1 dTDP-glucose 4,6-dehydratase [Malaciobacter molluscorum LMG 25693]